MKIKHSISVTKEEVDDLFNTVLTAALASYSTVDEQAVALSQAKEVFKTKLELLTSEAFCFGKKIGKYKADSKDTKMYSEEVTATTV